MKFIELDNNIQIPIIDEPIGINVSGGADSALLLYYLMKYYKSKIYIVTLADRSKFLRNSKKSIDVVSKCSELTGNTNFEHTIQYADKQLPEVLFNGLELLLKNKVIKLKFNGITANPPDNVLATFKTPTKEHELRNPMVYRDPISKFRIVPWTNIDKKVIAELYIKEGLIDTLFPLTNSCEWDGSTSFNKGTNPYVDHCGQCWWCEERYWGFNRLS